MSRVKVEDVARFDPLPHQALSTTSIALSDINAEKAGYDDLENVVDLHNATSTKTLVAGLSIVSLALNVIDFNRVLWTYITGMLCLTI